MFNFEPKNIFDFDIKPSLKFTNFKTLLTNNNHNVFS